MRRAIITIGLAVLMLGLGKTTQAEWITIQIEGVVDYVSDFGNHLQGKVDVGDIITGWYTYNTATPDSSPLDPAQGNYWYYSAPAGVSLQINELIFKTDFENVQFQMAMRNDIPTNGYDIYAFNSFNNTTSVNETLIDSINWQLIDYEGNALSSDVLPISAPHLGLWESNRFGIVSDRSFIIGGYIISAVPEPTTLLFLALGTLGIYLRKIPKS
jgi:hypothetical protein